MSHLAKADEWLRPYPPKSCVRVAIVGDKHVGKSSIISAFAFDSFSQKRDVKDFDFYSVKMQLGAHETTVDVTNLTFPETPGREPPPDKRKDAYATCDVVIFAFSLVDPLSFARVKSFYMKEVQDYAPHAKTVLVGTKIDMLEDVATIGALVDRGMEAVTTEQAKDLQRSLEMDAYCSCSAKTREGVIEVFTTCVDKASKPARAGRVCPCLSLDKLIQRLLEGLREKISRF
eukprot:c47378_g1_i1.p1 GENE.c47378_g1_i1~~c47378_g1_i1.p1  ORF type:complete len:231 (+),score=41.29 c47378_g1_i1:45-737(+)